jgi:hypothetical protein
MSIQSKAIFRKKQWKEERKKRGDKKFLFACRVHRSEFQITPSIFKESVGGPVVNMYKVNNALIEGCYNYGA